MFKQCKDLVLKLQAKEFLVRSSDPQTAEQVEEMIEDEGEKRKNIREIRLQRYLLFFQSRFSWSLSNWLSRYADMAQKDTNFQSKVMESLDLFMELLQDNQKSRERSTVAFERMVDALEAQNKYCCC